MQSIPQRLNILLSQQEVPLDEVYSLLEEAKSKKVAFQGPTNPLLPKEKWTYYAKECGMLFMDSPNLV